MSTQNQTEATYFRPDLQRQNLIQKWLFAIVIGICSYPRLIAEVFLRRHAGERYMGPMSMATVGIILFYLPWTNWFDNYHNDSLWNVILSQKAWYAFVAAYVIFAAKRWLEIRRDPSVFDFGKYSKSAGYFLPFFNRVKDKDGNVNFRLIEIWLEPALILVIGFFCSLINSHLGLLLMGCAIIYSISYMATYNLGDHALMDIFDKRILNEELAGIIIDGNGPDNARGARIYAKRPGTHEARKDLVAETKKKRKDDEDDDDSSVAV